MQQNACAQQKIENKRKILEKSGRKVETILWR